MQSLELYTYCSPTPKNIIPLIIVLFLFYVVGKLIYFLKKNKIKKKKDNI